MGELVEGEIGGGGVTVTKCETVGRGGRRKRDVRSS